MPANETPLQAAKRRYGSKDKLVEAVIEAMRSAGEDVAEMQEHLQALSNRKLLRLVEVSETVVRRYGNKDKLVEALSGALGRAKDGDYTAKLRTLSVPRLLDMARSAEKRAQRARPAS